MGAWGKITDAVRDAWSFYDPSKMEGVMSSPIVDTPTSVITWPLMFALSVAKRLVFIAAVVAMLVVMLVVVPLYGPFILSKMRRELKQERELASERLRRCQALLITIDAMSTKLARAKNLLRESETVLRRPDWTGHHSQLDLRIKRFLEE